MAGVKFTLEFPYTKEEIESLLKVYELTHIKQHTDHVIQKGDALKSKRGVLATVVRVEYEQGYITLANNHLTAVQMANIFRLPVWVRDQIYDYEGLKAQLKLINNNNLKT